MSDHILNRSSKTWLKNYWICFACAKEKGGTEPDNNVTSQIGHCKYCDEKGIVIVPWVDFGWPDNEELDRHAKNSRD